ncbi:MAG: HD domain-containing phosphohydrolase [Thermodesulfobacteriota bacterium]
MSVNGSILVVDDNDSIRDLLKNLLISEGYTVITADNGTTALEKLKGINFDLVISDIMMPGISGLELLIEVRKLDEDMPVVMITGFPTIDTAVKVIKEGANDFITKPFNLDHAKLVVKRSVENGRLKKQNKTLSDKMEEVDKIKAISRDLQEKVSELSALYTVSDVLHHVFSTSEVFVKALDMAISITEAGRAAIWVLDTRTRELALQAGSKFNVETGGRVPLDSAGLLTEPFLNDTSAVSGDYSECLCNAYVPGRKHSVLCVPVKIGSETFAALQICDKIGAMDFTGKDLSIMSDLANKISLRLENLALYENLSENIFKSITSLVTAIDARDNYTMNHCKRVTNYAVEFAKGINLSNEIIDAFRFAGPIHDVGKIGVRDDILLKPGKLDDEEFALMRAHVTIGDDIVGHLNLGSNERMVVRNHHEKFDGNGYPDGLKHDKIPLVARIFTIVDTYDAMTTNRPYRKARTHEDALEELAKCSGTQFDGELVKDFLRLDPFQAFIDDTNL